MKRILCLRLRPSYMYVASTTNRAASCQTRHARHAVLPPDTAPFLRSGWLVAVTDLLVVFQTSANALSKGKAP